MNVSSNTSSIQAHQSYMNVNATNIANTNSEGFAPARTTMHENGDAVKATFSQESIDASSQSQTDLSKELTDQVNIERTLEANVSAIKVKDDMFGSLLDIKA
ncbi:MAG: hypothetical protein U9P71_01375 [Campylobacterota bacterium]|nr:hypothetical protein [Campylobacterota bacterium]